MHTCFPILYHVWAHPLKEIAYYLLLDYSSQLEKLTPCKLLHWICPRFVDPIFYHISHSNVNLFQMWPTFECKIVQIFSQLVQPFLGYSQGLKYDGFIVWLGTWDSLNVTAHWHLHVEPLKRIFRYLVSKIHHIGLRFCQVNRAFWPVVMALDSSKISFI